MNRQWKAVRNIGGIALWGVFIIFCAIHRNEMTPEAIAASVSRNPWLAVVVLLAMFALKSVSVFFYENLKSHIHATQEAATNKVHFFFAFHSERPLTEHLIEAHEAVEKIRRKRCASPGNHSRE